MGAVAVNPDEGGHPDPFEWSRPDVGAPAHRGSSRQLPWDRRHAFHHLAHVLPGQIGEVDPVRCSHAPALENNVRIPLEEPRLDERAPVLVLDTVNEGPEEFSLRGGLGGSVLQIQDLHVLDE